MMAIAEANGQRLVACSQYSINNDAPSAEVERVITEYFQPMGLSEATRVRWFLAKYAPPEAMDFAKFADIAWESALAHKEKRQAIIFHTAHGYYSFVFKPDQGRITLTVEGMEPELYKLVVPANRYDQHRTKIHAVSQLLEAASEYTANVQLERASRANTDEIEERVSAMTNEEFLRDCLMAKMALYPDDYQVCLKKAKAVLKGLRNEGAKRRMKEPMVFRVGENPTKLEYPRDFPQLLEKKGETYNPRTERTEYHTVAEYTDTKLHMEKVLVLWGKGGRGKTPTADAVAKHFAISYDTNRYMSTGNVDALKEVQDEFGEHVPVVLEDMSANDTSQHGRKLSANYLKHLLNVQDGGQCRIRNKNINFFRRQPRILCINDSPQDWMRAVHGLTDADGVPLAKRLFFVNADEMLVSAEAIASHEEDLEEIVREGKRRKMDYDRAHGIVAVETPTASTTASTQGSSLDTISDFEPFEGGEMAPTTQPLPSRPIEICGNTQYDS